MSLPRSRFYREVDTSPSPLVGERAPRAGEGHQILLDGKAVKTPAGARLLLPNSALADAIANEWRAQDKTIRPQTMILTKLANTAIDRVAPQRQDIVDQILAFGRSDLVCYRGEAQTSLAEQQARAWNPLLEWLDARHGAKLKAGSGLVFIEQPEAALRALQRAVAAYDDFMLAGLHATATLCGSAVIALALANGSLDAAGAFEAAHVDEFYQWARWGKDAEAEAKVENKRLELTVIANFLQLLRNATAH